ncbi:MAG TPA: aconitate hydratase [Candidatus Polarisedimenticolia bacterium]|jgi:aconitate hydratase|nr:aconitate hydratase [Candidatus Polarisedimenticolia bacterium]
MNVIDSTPEFVSGVYQRMTERLAAVRARLKRPLTFVEKIIFSHLNDPAGQDLRPGESYLMLRPDRVAMQDATAQMALLQFMVAGRPSVAVPTTVHCDHLIRAREGAAADLHVAFHENQEVYEFLKAASSKYGIGFWKPGAGIIHQVILENYAFPGGLLIGTDSHTPNAGGLGMLSCGVGGADAVDVMAGFPWEVLYPKLIGVRLTGSPSGWTAPKDVILHLCGLLTTEGGTNRVLEYFGPGTRSISCTGKATITNMGAELGATGSVFPFDDRMEAYLRGTWRGAQADLAKQRADMLRADPEVEERPERFFDRVVEIDLAKLEPYLVGPHRPDLARKVSEVKAAVKKEGYPERLSVALVGSCTNSSYEDIERAADVAKQAIAHHAKVPIPLLVTPGSEQIRATIERDGQMAILRSVGAKVLANACGPCIGQWHRDDIVLRPEGQRKNAIITSFNRNFPKRNDGIAETMAFMGSPEIVMAYGLSGRLDFNPLTDEIQGPDGKPWKLSPPKPAPDLPAKGFVRDESGYVPPADGAAAAAVAIDPGSDRLQALSPFPAWDGKDLLDLPVILKAKGPCTTDHISPAGPWLRYRGHLDKISDNLFAGAINAFTPEPGTGIDPISGAPAKLAAIARHLKSLGRKWVAAGDVNYGEGSSREHAAMSPRHLGCAAILARSFARIHESNLKKQGVLPLTFADPAFYDRIRPGDEVSFLGLSGLAPGAPLEAKLRHQDGAVESFRLNHTLNPEQIEWFKAGSALNLLRLREAARS